MTGGMMEVEASSLARTLGGTEIYACHGSACIWSGLCDRRQIELADRTLSAAINDTLRHSDRPATRLLVAPPPVSMPVIEINIEY